MANKQSLSQKLIPVSLAAGTIIFDQISKALVVKNIPRLTYFSEAGDGSIINVLGNALRLIHVRNTGAAFSMGNGLPQTLRSILLAIIPLIVIALVFAVYFRNNDFTKTQRWCICGILGGGLGNLIDRFFRPDGVVDFIDCIFFGSIKGVNWPTKGIFSWLSMERWPTFNIADSVIVVCGIIFVITFIVQFAKEKKGNND
jgi:signal peptidase II